MSNSGSMHMGGGGGEGKCAVQDVSVTKYIDLASSKLGLCCSKGTHIPEGTLVVRKAGGDPMEYLIIKMKKILVSSVSTGGSGGEDRLTENITLNFSWVELKYKSQKDDGTAGPGGGFSYDIETNTATAV